MPQAAHFLNIGVRLHHDGRLAEAEQVYRAVLSGIDPFNPDAYHLLGLLRAAEGNFAQAVPLVRQAVALCPDFLAAMYTNLGNHCVGLRRYGDAVRCYRSAMAIDPVGQAGTAAQLDMAFRHAVGCEWSRLSLDTRDIVLYPRHPGLGDQLIYSTLPELFARRGKRVFISDMTRVRSREVFDLVWGCNPYVSGESSGPAAAGFTQWYNRCEYDHIGNLVTRLEMLHGFLPTSDLPRVYYQPKPHPTLAGRVLVETHSQTVRYPEWEIDAYVAAVARKFGYKLDEMTRLTFAQAGISQENSMGLNLPVHRIGSIFELCDALASAKSLITVHSGGNSLAAALKRNESTPIIHCAVDAEHFNEKCYIWQNVDYTIVRSLHDAGGPARCL